MSIKVLAAITSMLVISGAAWAGDVSVAKQFIEKTGTIKQAESAMNSVGQKQGGKALELAKEINWRQMNDSYAQALADVLSNEEMQALIKAYDIPRLQEAMQKLPVAAGKAQKAVETEINRAAKKIGLQPPASSKTPTGKK